VPPLSWWQRTEEPRVDALERFIALDKGDFIVRDMVIKDLA